MRFYGDIAELKELIAKLRLKGRWFEQPNQVWRFKTMTRASVHWAATTKKLWIDGPPEFKGQLESLIRDALPDPLFE